MMELRSDGRWRLGWHHDHLFTAHDPGGLLGEGGCHVCRAIRLLYHRRYRIVLPESQQSQAESCICMRTTDELFLSVIQHQSNAPGNTHQKELTHQITVLCRRYDVRKSLELTCKGVERVPLDCQNR